MNKFIIASSVFSIFTSGCIFATGTTTELSPKQPGTINIPAGVNNKIYEVTPNNIDEIQNSKETATTTLNSGGTVTYTFSGEAEAISSTQEGRNSTVQKTTPSPYSRTVTITETTPGSCTVNGTINISASDKIPSGTTYTQTITNTSNGDYSVTGSTSTGMQYSAKITPMSITSTDLPTNGRYASDVTGGGLTKNVYDISGTYTQGGDSYGFRTVIPCPLSIQDLSTAVNPALLTASAATP